MVDVAAAAVRTALRAGVRPNNGGGCRLQGRLHRLAADLDHATELAALRGRVPADLEPLATTLGVEEAAMVKWETDM